MTLEHRQPGMKPGPKPEGYNFWTCEICNGTGKRLDNPARSCPNNSQHFLDSAKNDALLKP